MSGNGISFDNKSLGDLEKQLSKLMLTDRQKQQVVDRAADEMLERVKDGTPIEEGNVQKGWKKKQSNYKNGYVITNDYEDENGSRIPFILEYKESKSQGFFSRTVDENEDDIEEMILEDLEKLFDL